MEEHGNISEHLANMYGSVQLLKDLGCEIPEELVIDRVLLSLPPTYKDAITNYDMIGTSKSLSEILMMLNMAELEIKMDKMAVTVRSLEAQLPKYLEDKKAGKIVGKEKGIFDIHVIDVYLTCARPNPSRHG